MATETKTRTVESVIDSKAVDFKNFDDARKHFAHDLYSRFPDVRGTKAGRFLTDTERSQALLYFDILLNKTHRKVPTRLSYDPNWGYQVTAQFDNTKQDWFFVFGSLPDDAGLFAASLTNDSGDYFTVGTESKKITSVNIFNAYQEALKIVNRVEKKNAKKTK